jgi:hypothetical protein
MNSLTESLPEEEIRKKLVEDLYNLYFTTFKKLPCPYKGYHLSS